MLQMSSAETNERCPVKACWSSLEISSTWFFKNSIWLQFHQVPYAQTYMAEERWESRGWSRKRLGETWVGEEFRAKMWPLVIVRRKLKWWVFTIFWYFDRLQSGWRKDFLKNSLYYVSKLRSHKECRIIYSCMTETNVDYRSLSLPPVNKWRTLQQQLWVTVIVPGLGSRECSHRLHAVFNSKGKWMTDPKYLSSSRLKK